MNVNEIIDDDYHRGLKDAWNCMKEITELSRYSYEEIFGAMDYITLFSRRSASWAMDKLHNYKGEIKKPITYGEIYEIFCKEFPDVKVTDYRPAAPMYVPELTSIVPGGIILWLEDGSRLIYILKKEGV